MNFMKKEQNKSQIVKTELTTKVESQKNSFDVYSSNNIMYGMVFILIFLMIIKYFNYKKFKIKQFTEYAIEVGGKKDELKSYSNFAPKSYIYIFLNKILDKKHL